MSISALRFVLGGFMCATTACADEPSSDGDASSGEVSSSESSSALDGSSSESDVGTSVDGEDSSGAAGDTGDPTPSWTLDSNININDQDIEEAIVSVVAVQAESDGVVYTSIVFTDAPAYCDALASENCGAGTFTFRVSLAGLEPGTYDAAGTVAFASFGDLTESCLSGGFGATSGTITFSRVDTGPGGLVEASFDLEIDFLGAYATGSVVASICE
jgi:hypothetical protein